MLSSPTFATSEMSGLDDRFAALLAVRRVSGMVVLASSFQSSHVAG